MIKFKEKITNEIKNINLNCTFSTNAILNENKDIYNKLYEKYISQEFTINCISFSNRIILNSKSIPNNIRNEKNIYKIFTSIIKQMMLNEYELTLYSLYLDLLKWNNNYSIDEFFTYLALYIKEITYINDYVIIYNYFKIQNKNVENNYQNFKKCNKLLNDIQIFPYNLVNDRFKFLKMPFNQYCKNNFIDYNNIVDNILNVSQPYDNKFKKNMKIKNNNMKVMNLKKNSNLYTQENQISINEQNKTQLNNNNYQHKNNNHEKTLNEINNANNTVNIINQFFQEFNYNLNNSQYSNIHNNEDYLYNNFINKNKYQLFNYQYENPINQFFYENINKYQDNLDKYILNRNPYFEKPDFFNQIINKINLNKK